MSSEFSDYVQSLGPQGQPPDVSDFDRLLETLRRALVHEMKKRSLWTSPPSYLGIFGGVSWTDGDLLEELLLDCYSFIFVRRLPGLKKQLLVRPNIDGLVFLNIRNFLHEAQKRHDPLGFRIFEVLHAAVLGRIDAGSLHVLSGDPKVRNDTLLGFCGRDWSAAEGGSQRENPAVNLRPIVAVWVDDLMPELVTAWNRDEVQAKLEHSLEGLTESNVAEACRFRDLVEPLKEEARSRWHSLRLSEEGETASEQVGGQNWATIVRLVRPDLGYEERESFHRLLDCTAGRLDGIGSKKTQDYLIRLWFFLRGWAYEPNERRPEVSLAPAFTEHTPSDKPPSDKKLSEVLEIPRARIPGLKQILGGLVEDCRRAGDTKTGYEAVTMNQQSKTEALSRRETLRLQTGATAASWAKIQEEQASAGTPPGPGDMFLFPGTREFPVEWAVLEEDWKRRRLLVVPMDDQPFLGSHDVARDEDVRLRCAHGVWLDAATFQVELRTGCLGDDVLGRAREKRVAIEAGIPKESWSRQETNNDPEYRAWTTTLVEARAALPVNLARFTPGAERRRTPLSSKVWPGYALAAGFAAAALGLSLWLTDLRHQVEELSKPILVASSATREIRFLDGRRSETIQLGADETHVSIYLLLSESDRFQFYRVELLNTEGVVVWSRDMDRGAGFELILTVARRFLEKSVYDLRLSGLEEGSEGEVGRVKILDVRGIRVNTD